MIIKTIVGAALAGGLSFGIGLPAQAVDAACSLERTLVSPAVAAQPAVYGEAPLLTPARDAWTERVLVSPAVEEVSRIVRHPAQYAERTVIDQPYVAAVAPVDEVSHIVHHPAVTTVVHHPAVTTVVHHAAVTRTVHHPAVTTTDYVRYSWVGAGTPAAGDTPLTHPGNWSANNKKYDGSPTGVLLHKGNGNGSYFYWVVEQVVEQAAWDETVIDVAAWDETVVVTPAWDEKVIDVAAQPGTPEQPEISHIEYDLVREAYDEVVIDTSAREAVYMDVEHEAQDAVYGEPVLITPAVPGRDAVYEETLVCDDDTNLVERPGQPDTESKTPETTGPNTSGTVGGGTSITGTSITGTSTTGTSTTGGNVPAASGAGANHVAATGPQPAALAYTGGTVDVVVPIAAGALLALGGVALLAGRRRTQN